MVRRPHKPWSPLQIPPVNEDVQQEFNSLQAPRSQIWCGCAKRSCVSFIRVATIRAKLAVVDLDSIGIALKQGLVSVEGAVAWLDDLGLFEIVVQGR